MAAAIQSSGLLSPSAARRFLSSSFSLSPPAVLSINVAPFSSPSLLSKKRSNSRTIRVQAHSGKYIREDYLVKKVSAKEVEEMVKGERSVPLIVDFYATWCGPCILMAQELEMLAVEYDNNALFVKVDTDDEYQFARDMQVRGLPTLYFISPNPSKDAIRTEGLVPRDMIKNIIDNEM